MDSSPPPPHPHCYILSPFYPIIYNIYQLQYPDFKNNRKQCLINILIFFILFFLLHENIKRNKRHNNSLQNIWNKTHIMEWIVILKSLIHLYFQHKNENNFSRLNSDLVVMTFFLTSLKFHVYMYVCYKTPIPMDKIEAIDSWVSYH